MQAFLLAAGVGSRLRPLTDRMPKVMAPLSDDGPPLLEAQIRNLTRQGVTRFVINLHHMGDQIVQHFGDGARFGAEIRYSYESEGLLDTAGALRRAADLLDDEFLLIYGDQLHQYDFTRLRRLHRERKALATVVLKRSDSPQDGDLAEPDPASGRILRWHGRPHGITEYGENLYLNTGLDVLSKRIIDFIPEGRPVSLDREIIPRLVVQGEPIYGLPEDLEILDIGTPAKYAFAQRRYADWLEERAPKERALLLDRDGTLIRALPRGQYLTRRDQIEVLPGALELLQAARRLGYKLIVVTNQPQVRRGMVTTQQLNQFHDYIACQLDRLIDAFYVCPHVEADNCSCRKPKPGLLQQAARDFALDPDLCWMLGDSDKDTGAAQAFGCRCAFLHNEHNKGEAARARPDAYLHEVYRALPLLDAVAV